MIAILTSRTTWYAVAALAAAVALWWIHGTVYNNGYRAAVTQYEAILAQERFAHAEAALNEQRRQDIANAAAKQREAAAIAQIEAEQAANQELRKRLADEARQDPNADRVAIGADGVRRIDQIR